VVAVMAVVALVLASPIVAVIAIARLQGLSRELADVRAEMGTLRGRMDVMSRRLAGGAASAPAATPAPLPEPAPTPVTSPLPTPAPVVAAAVTPPPAVTGPTPAAPPAPTPVAPPAGAAVPPRPRVPAGGAPRPPARNFAANLGPKILAAGAGLAFVVTLGLFVKLAWDNNWI